MRGPGETQIETDRRIILNKISLLKKNLKDIDKQMSTQRKNRGKMVRVALVGYTNVGKSTIMNMLSKSDVFAENKLFATLDTTVRKVIVENLPFLLTDTVGFIRDLPPELFAAFRATLEELNEADVLLHVVDVSNPDFESHIAAVEKVLSEIGVLHKPTLMIFNKEDCFPDKEMLANLCRRFEATAVSALSPGTLSGLSERLETRLGDAWRSSPHTASPPPCSQ